MQLCFAYGITFHYATIYKQISYTAAFSKIKISKYLDVAVVHEYIFYEL